MLLLDEHICWETDTRYYHARLGRDLFGQIVVDRCWGGKRNRLGGMATDPFDNEDEARRALQALTKTRERHGYRIVSPATPDQQIP